MSEQHKRDFELQAAINRRMGRTLVERLEAAGRDERLSTGALYLEAAAALAQAQARCAELEKEREAAYDKSWANVQRADQNEKDAARYRWLRERDQFILDHEKIAWHGYGQQNNAQKVDAAIDAAMEPHSPANSSEAPPISPIPDPE